MGVAVIGAGYWGPNLIRNFAAHPACRVRWVHDVSEHRARRAIGTHSTIRVASTLDQVLSDPKVDVVAIATPAATHAGIAMAALAAGKHVVVEKPLACSVAEGAQLITAAERSGRHLMVDHTYCYTPAVLALRELSLSGVLGDIQYVDSVRINLGLVQSDVDVVWDLAPHDLSVLDVILPPENRPVAVAAHCADPIGAGRACVGYLSMPLAMGGIAHAHVNWLSPTKIRTTIVAGSKRTAVWNDLDPVQRLSVFDRGVDLEPAAGTLETRERLQVSYRVGDMIAPALPETEPLQAMVCELVAAIREDRAPLTDGEMGLRVIATLEAVSKSQATGGLAVPLAANDSVGAAA